MNSSKSKSRANTIKPKKGKQRLTLVKEILLQIYETGLFLQENFPNRYKLDFSSRSSKRTISKTVSRLKKDGYLKEIEIKGKKRYLTTLKGKVKILAYLKKDKKWDGKWRIVVFDIPEKKRKMRNFFREKLRDLGFRILQESVWICPYNIADSVEDLIILCQAKPYIHYLLVEELDNRDTLMKLFKLRST